MSIPREFIELLLAKIDLVDLINTQVPLQKKSGSNYFARCPFHQEKSASFSVSQPKQFYYCFGCGAHGNAIDFMIQHDRLTFPEAIEALARLAGMEVPNSGEYVKKDDSIPALYELMTKVSAYFYEQMRNSQLAIEYLKQRGISGVTAQQFQIGYAHSGWNHLLDQFGKTDAEKKQLLDTGLIIKKEEGGGYYDRFRERIMFPIHDHRGRIIGFGGRILQTGEPKYLNSPETVLFQKGHELYGLFQAMKLNRKLDRVLIVEGYMDVIALFQHGVTYAVATLGTATTAHHLQRLFRYTAEIIFCFDGDQAGKTAASRALQVIFPLLNDNLQIRFLFLPDGEDPDSLIQKEGKEAFEKRIDVALSLADFFFQTTAKQCDMQTMEGRARFAALSLNQIKQLPASIFQGMMLDELSKRARVDLHELKSQVKNREETQPTELKSTPDQNKLKLPNPLRLALALLIQHPSLAQHLPEKLEEMDHPGYHLFKQIIDIVKQSPAMTTGILREYWRGQKEEAFIAKLSEWDHMVPEKGMESEFLGAIRQLTTLNLDEEINRLLAKAGLENLDDAEKMQLTGLIAKKKALIT